MGVSIEIRGLPEVLKQIAALKEAAGNMEPHLRAASGVFKRSILKNFRAGGRPTGWVAKSDGSPSHLMSSAKKLAASINVKTVTNNEIRIGTNVVYAAIHQFGGTIRPKKAGGFLVFSLGGKKIFARSVTMPARPFLVIPEEDKRICFNVILDSIWRKILR